MVTSVVELFRCGLLSPAHLSGKIQHPGFSLHRLGQQAEAATTAAAKACHSRLTVSSQMTRVSRRLSRPRGGLGARTARESHCLLYCVPCCLPLLKLYLTTVVFWLDKISSSVLLHGSEAWVVVDPPLPLSPRSALPTLILLPSATVPEWHQKTEHSSLDSSRDRKHSKQKHDNFGKDWMRCRES